MTTYRRKPEHISAVQLTQEAIRAHVLDKAPLPDGCIVTSWDAHLSMRTVHRAVVRLQTKERELVMPGDWIVRDTAGTLRVVKPEAFAAMYEAEPGWRSAPPTLNEVKAGAGWWWYRQRGEDGYTAPHVLEIGWDDDGLFFVEPDCPRVTPEEYGDDAEWYPCPPPTAGGTP